MISLADLRARNITPVWQEAVAVVQELIHTVRATSGSAELLPDLEHIALIPNGDVVAMPGSPGPDHPVRHAAVMLKLLLDNTPVPPELDAFVQRNIADPPQFDSVAEFSRNLAFFERPGRRSDVERLVGRAMASEQTRRADEELRRLKERANEVEQTVTQPAFLAAPKRLRTVPVPLVAVLLFAVIGGAVWWWMNSGPADQFSAAAVEVADAGDAAAESATEVGNGTVAGTEAVAGDVTAGEAESAGARSGGAGSGGAGSGGAGSGGASAPPSPTVPAMTPRPEERSILQRTTDAVRTAVSSLLGGESQAAPAAPRAPAPDDPRPGSARRASRTPGASAASSPPAALPGVPAAPADAAPAPAPSAASGDAVNAARTAPADAGEEAFVAPAAEAMIFTARDPDVMPPVLVRPVLPKEPPPNVPEDQIGTIEVVVDEQGDVVTVRLISPGNRYHERMLVSAAKMWKFRPAYKDGRPVRYRTRVRLTI